MPRGPSIVQLSHLTDRPGKHTLCKVRWALAYCQICSAFAERLKMSKVLLCHHPGLLLL